MGDKHIVIGYNRDEETKRDYPIGTIVTVDKIVTRNMGKISEYEECVTCAHSIASKEGLCILYNTN